MKNKRCSHRDVLVGMDVYFSLQLTAATHSENSHSPIIVYKPTDIARKIVHFAPSASCCENFRTTSAAARAWSGSQQRLGLRHHLGGTKPRTDASEKEEL
jgi:hypothetical protein